MLNARGIAGCKTGDRSRPSSTVVVAGLDLLKLDSRSSFADLPDKAKVPLLITQAEFLSVQRTNPLKHFQQRWSLPAYASTSAPADRPAHRPVSEREPVASPGNPLLFTGRVRRTKEPPTVNRGKTPPTEPLTPGERRVMLIAIGVFVGVIAAGSTAWGINDPSVEPYGRSGDGCVNVTFASSTGGAIQHACGTAARDLCRSVDGQHNPHADAVQAQCRVAGISP